MSTEQSNQLPEENINSSSIHEVIPSMDDFKDQIEKSFKKIQEGDLMTGIVIGISETELTLDLGYYTEGIIKLEELSNDPSFSIKADVSIGEEISAVVLSQDNGHGHILLSKKRADNILAWDQLVTLKDNRTIVKVKIAQAVNGGVVTYLEGIRAFIPASHLSIQYVEDVSSFVGKEMEAIVITADKENQKLVLSAKEVERDQLANAKRNKISSLQVGLVTTGIVEKIAPYGAFVSIGDGLSGLVHISQICGKRIKSPSEVLKLGDQVTVKLIEVRDGKVSLSMTAVEDKEEIIEDVEETQLSYSSGESVTTTLGDLLKNFKF